MHATILAVDPGTSGAIAILTGELLRVYDVPSIIVRRGRTNRSRIDAHRLQALCVRLSALEPDHTLIEDVWGLPGQSAPATHAFGVCCGQLSQALISVGLRPQLVAAATWKQALKVAGDKDASLSRARALWPGSPYFARKGDHNRADAALIAHYGAQLFLNANAPKTRAAQSSAAT